MKKFKLQTAAWLMAAVWLHLGLWSVSDAQELPRSRNQRQSRVDDRDLRAFAKVYVTYQSLQKEYEPILKSEKDAKKKEGIQKEANAKLKAVLQQQGLTADQYNQIFASVNADEKLRKRVLSMINEERNKS